MNTFCHVQRPTQKEFPEDIQKEILKELIDAAPESALAKHKTRTRKPHTLRTSNASDVPHIFETLFTKDHANSLLSDYAKFQFFEHVGSEMTISIKRFSLDMLTTKEREFYENEVCVSDDRAKQICESTLDQQCTLWQHERKKRITGSICRELYTFHETESRTWAAKIERIYQNRSFAGNKATAYGRENEPCALREYERLQNVTVNRLGLVVVPEVPWLGYSPDGVLIQGNKRILVEVKCPVLGQEQSIAELVRQKKLTYIVEHGENYALKLKHTYYSQIQLGLMLLNLDLCHLVVHSKVESLVIPVTKDVQHMRELLDRLQYVYFKKVLPKLADISKR